MFKAESLQRAGHSRFAAHSTRSATSAKKSASAGAIAASAGNHAQGVALAARIFQACVDRHRHAGICPADQSGEHAQLWRRGGAAWRASTMPAQRRELQEARGLTYVHAFDDPMVIAGQGTIGLEVASLPEMTAL